MELQKENIIQSQGKIPSTSKELHCNFCPRKFTEQRDLVRHVTIIHKENIEGHTSVIHCNYCGERFTEHKNLARHVSDVHHDIPQYMIFHRVYLNKKVII